MYERKILSTKFRQRKDLAVDYEGSPMDRGGTHNSGLAENAEIEQKFKGYTDCGCKAGWTPGVVLDPFSVAARPARSLPSTDETGSE